MFNRRLALRTTSIILSFIVIMGTIYYMNIIYKENFKKEEREVALFAEALKSMENPNDNELNLYWKILENNKTIPILIFDKKGKLLQHKNIRINSKETQLSKFELLRSKKMSYDKFIRINIGQGVQQDIYYSKSKMLNRLQYMPLIQLSLILLFTVGFFLFFKNLEKMEQNRVWAGLSKETAHQLGTPISSLFAWVEVLKNQGIKQDVIDEINKDLDRLKVVTDRFSKIGSSPKLTHQNIIPLIEDTAAYMSTRISSHIKIEVIKNKSPIFININEELFAWVIENLIKNAVDSMTKKGKITISTFLAGHEAIVDVKDTGKGISPMSFEKIFAPGYTTKKRGWGLGLSLVKRIVKDYHNGRIFVQNSELGKGTIIRMTFPKSIKE